MSTNVKDEKKQGDKVQQPSSISLTSEEEDCSIENHRRVLSIQSHVVSGYVGNKAAVFPLQLLGYDVDIINSVHFANHTGYNDGGEIKGDVLSGDQLLEIVEGLKQNFLLDKINYVLTGFIGSSSFLNCIVDVITTIRGDNEQDQEQQERHHYQQTRNTRQLQYICDPVLGDHNKFYVPIELVDIYRNKIIPLAQIITPNQFEIEQLSDTKISTIENAIDACNKLHKLGPSLIFITSLILQKDEYDEYQDENNEDEEMMTILASQRWEEQYRDVDDNGEEIFIETEKDEIWRIDIPVIQGDGPFTGTGDLCSALILAHVNNCNNEKEGKGNQKKDRYTWSSTTTKSTRICHNLPSVMEKVVGTMYSVISRTANYSNSKCKYCNKSNSIKNSSGNDDDLDSNDNEKKQQQRQANNIASRELQLIQSKNDIENPPILFKAYQIR